MKAHVLCGLDRLNTIDAVLRGKRLGLMTNPTGIDSHFRSSIDILHQNYKLTALFSCEHGVRGDAQAGARIETYQDPETGVMVYSCYGKSHRMQPEMTEHFDILVFDMQDVGARFYTYLYSLSYAMEACAQAGKPIVVLDRLNPIGGEQVSGTILDEKFHSFVGEYAMPTRYGLTIGEYARWVKNHLKLDLDLTVVPLSGWKRSMYLEDTDTPWVAPSPNCATYEAALVYTGTCIFEGSNLSEGRGTTQPFEVIGAPWLNANELEKRMIKLGLPGVYFRRTCFTPMFSKCKGELCFGVQVHVTNRDAFTPFEAGLLLMEEVRNLHPDQFEFISYDMNPGTPSTYPIDRLLGTDIYRFGKMDARQMIQHYAPMIAEFKGIKKQFELYHE